MTAVRKLIESKILPLFSSEREWREWKRLLMRMMAVAACFHLLASVFSRGFLSADEHFQILEFISFKLGRLDPAFHSIEFPTRMRPWLQPGIGYVLFAFLRMLGINEPLTWAFVFRLFSVMLGMLSLFVLAVASPFYVRGIRARHLVLKSSALLCFLPALHARPSSENWAGATFAVALAALTIGLGSGAARPEISDRTGLPASVAALAGFFTGLSFEFRFQMGIAVAGAAIWLAIYYRRQIERKAVFAAVFSFFIVFFIGRLSDHWGYGDWSFSPWYYLKINILQGYVSAFGRSPWWDYFRISLTEAWPPFGAIALGTAIVSWIVLPRSILTWASLAFFLVHVAIAHKELRFLYPFAHASPLFLGIALDRWKAAERLWSWKAIRIPILVLNSTGLVMLCLLPASRHGPLYPAIWRELPASHELYTFGEDPFNHLGSPVTFYTPPGYRLKRVASWQDLAFRAKSHPDGILLFYTAYDLPPDVGKDLSCEPRYRNFPSGLVTVAVKIFGRIPENVRVQSLFYCHPR